MTYEHPSTTEPSGKAIASLIFGILGLVGPCPLLGSILAIVLGNDEPGSIAKGGVVCGWIGLGLAVLGAIVGLLLLLGVLSLSVLGA